MSMLESYLEPFPFLCILCPLCKNGIVYSFSVVYVNQFGPPSTQQLASVWAGNYLEVYILGQ